MANYSFTGLTQQQLADNASAVKNSTYGKTVNIYVYPQATQQAFTLNTATGEQTPNGNAVFNLGAGQAVTAGKVATTDGDAQGIGSSFVQVPNSASRVPFTTLQNAVLANIRAPKGTTVSGCYDFGSCQGSRPR